MTTKHNREEEMDKRQFEIVGHSLGIDINYALRSEREKDKYLPEDFYRNYFQANEGHEDVPVLQELVELGHMEKWKNGDLDYYSVTDKGIEEFRKQFFLQVTSQYKRPSRSKQRYLDFLELDSDMTFAEYLGIKKKKKEPVPVIIEPHNDDPF